MTMEINDSTNKIELIGKADGVPFTHSMEFAHVTKADILDNLKFSQSNRQTFNLIDIHGNFLAFNFERIKTFSVRVVEIFELVDAPREE